MPKLRDMRQAGEPRPRPSARMSNRLRFDHAVAIAVVAIDVILLSDLVMVSTDPTRGGLLLLIAVGIAAALGLRRVLPRLSFAGVAAATVAATSFTSWHSALPLCVALGTVVAHQSLRTGLFAFAAAVGVSVVAISSEVGVEVHFGRPLAAALAVAGYLVPIAVALGIGLWQRAGQVRLAHVRDRQRIVTATAVTNERLKLAHDLHDTLAQRVSVMVLQAAGAKRVMHEDPAAAEVALDGVALAGAQAGAELRAVLGVLRVVPTAVGAPLPSPAPVWLGPEPVAFVREPALRDLPELIDAVERVGVRCALRITGSRPRATTSEVELVAFRVISEALTNVVRHAGCGARVDIHLHYGIDTVGLTVRDDGRGVPSTLSTLSTRTGLRGMIERVVGIGGILSVSRPPAGGFQVSATLPDCAVGDRTDDSADEPRLGPMNAPSPTTATAEQPGREVPILRGPS